VCVSGGRGIWQENAKGRKRSEGLNPFGRGNAPARPPARSVGTLLTLRLICVYQPSTLPSISLCFDGQCLFEYEQKIQQSPALGRSIAPQLAHF